MKSLVTKKNTAMRTMMMKRKVVFHLARTEKLMMKKTMTKKITMMKKEMKTRKTMRKVKMIAKKLLEGKEQLLTATETMAR
jgi:hypothetical protein